MQSNIPDLWDHQKIAIDNATKLDCYGFLFEAGTGKSRATIDTLRFVYKKYGKLLPTIIFTPPVVISNWKKEFKKYSKVQESDIHLLTGSGKERLKKLKESPRNSIFVTNYEALLMPELREEMKQILLSETSCLVLDESHRCKSPDSKRTKYAIELADIASYRYILTGTPVLKNLMDIWAQFRILDRGERFGSNFWTFKTRFFEDKNKSMPKNKYFPRWEPIAGADRRIKEMIGSVSMYVEKSQCLSLPPLVKKTIEVEMGSEQRRLYETMKRDLVASITTTDGKKRHSIAELAITKALRLQQICSGHLRVEGENGEEGKTLTIKDNPRKEALREILEDLAPYHKIIVWAVFHANYEDIKEVCNSLGIGYAELHGLVKNKDEQADKFRNDPNCRLMIGHPGSGGIGLSLVEASYMIYYSRGFSLEFEVQSEARNYRSGSEQHTSITRIDLVCSGTIDEVVLNALASKQSISDSILKEKLNEL